MAAGATRRLGGLAAAAVVLLAPAAAGARPPAGTRLTVAATGDFLVHTPVFQRARAYGHGRRYDFRPMFRRIRPLIRRADLALCHVETPLTHGRPRSYPSFRTPAALARAIKATGWDACSTASNHTLDAGARGVRSTLRALERAGLKHAGSHRSRAGARRTAMLRAKGVKVAFLAYTALTNGQRISHPWTLDMAHRRRILRDARRARRRGADAVIVNLHWASEMAPEYVTEPSPEQEEMVKALSKAPEITALVGQGPHVVQPIREVAGKTVVFSEGNLTSNQGADMGLAPASQDGYIAQLDLTVDGDGGRVTGASYVPTWTDHVDYRVLPVGPALEAGDADPASLEASYERTVDVVGDDPAEPVPARLP